MLIAALCLIAQTWKQPSVSEWKDKLPYIRAAGLYSAVKRKGLSSHEKTRRNREFASLREGRRSEEAPCCACDCSWATGGAAGRGEASPWLPGRGRGRF